MNGLQVFENSEFGQLEVLIIDGKEFFSATACAKMLGYSRPADAITAHCKGAVKYRVPTAGGEQELKFIPEGDLFRLIMRSKLPAAQRFESWVCDEVLPALRRQGMYAPDLTEVVTKIVSAAITETIKQMVPIMQQTNTKTENAGEESFTQDVVVRRKRKPTFCAIEKLPSDIRCKVDQMLLSGQYSYRDVVQFLDSHGIRLSQMAVCTYYYKMHF